MKKYEKMMEMLAEGANDANKFFNKNNAAAGVRVRKMMQDVKALAQEIRIDVQDKKNS